MCLHAKLIQLCLTLYDPIDCCLPGSSVYRIIQVRILEWVAFPTPGDLPDPGIEPVSPISPKLQVDPLPLSHRGSPLLNMVLHYFSELISHSLQTYWPSCCFFLIIIYLFISGCTGSSLLHRIFSVVSMGYFLGVVHGFLIVVFLLLHGTGSRACRLQ